MQIQTVVVTRGIGLEISKLLWLMLGLSYIRVPKYHNFFPYSSMSYENFSLWTVKSLGHSLVWPQKKFSYKKEEIKEKLYSVH